MSLFKKATSFFLAVVMTAGMLSQNFVMQASANENVIQINNGEDFMMYLNDGDTGGFEDASLTFELNADIEVSPNAFSSSNPTRTLSATLNGNGHTIVLTQGNYVGRNNVYSTHFAGLFHEIKGELNDVRFIVEEGNGYTTPFNDNDAQTGSEETTSFGFVVGIMRNGSKITNCSVEPNVDGLASISFSRNQDHAADNINMGMIAGTMQAGAVIENCYVGDITLNFAEGRTDNGFEINIGSIVGEVSGGQIIGSLIDDVDYQITYQTSNNSATAMNVGSLFGKADSATEVRDCIVNNNSEFGVTVSSSGTGSNEESALSLSFLGESDTNDIYKGYLYALGNSSTGGYNISGMASDMADKRYTSVQEAINDPTTNVVNINTNDIGLNWQKAPSPSMTFDSDYNLTIDQSADKNKEYKDYDLTIGYEVMGQLASPDAPDASLATGVASVNGVKVFADENTLGNTTLQAGTYDLSALVDGEYLENVPSDPNIIWSVTPANATKTTSSNAMKANVDNGILSLTIEENGTDAVIEESTVKEFALTYRANVAGISKSETIQFTFTHKVLDFDTDIDTSSYEVLVGGSKATLNNGIYGPYAMHQKSDGDMLSTDTFEITVESDFIASLGSTAPDITYQAILSGNGVSSVSVTNTGYGVQLIKESNSKCTLVIDPTQWNSAYTDIVINAESGGTTIEASEVISLIKAYPTLGLQTSSVDLSYNELNESSQVEIIPTVTYSQGGRATTYTGMEQISMLGELDITFNFNNIPSECITYDAESGIVTLTPWIKFGDGSTPEETFSVNTKFTAKYGEEVGVPLYETLFVNVTLPSVSDFIIDQQYDDYGYYSMSESSSIIYKLYDFIHLINVEPIITIGNKEYRFSVEERYYDDIAWLDVDSDNSLQDSSVSLEHSQHSDYMLQSVLRTRMPLSSLNGRVPYWWQMEYEYYVRLDGYSNGEIELFDKATGEIVTWNYTGTPTGVEVDPYYVTLISQRETRMASPSTFSLIPDGGDTQEQGFDGYVKVTDDGLYINESSTIQKYSLDMKADTGEQFVYAVVDKDDVWEGGLPPGVSYETSSDLEDDDVTLDEDQYIYIATEQINTTTHERSNFVVYEVADGIVSMVDELSNVNAEVGTSVETYRTTLTADSFTGDIYTLAFDTVRSVAESDVAAEDRRDLKKGTLITAELIPVDYVDKFKAGDIIYEYVLIEGALIKPITSPTTEQKIPVGGEIEIISLQGKTIYFLLQDGETPSSGKLTIESMTNAVEWGTDEDDLTNISASTSYLGKLYSSTDNAEVPFFDDLRSLEIQAYTAEGVDKSETATFLYTDTENRTPDNITPSLYFGNSAGQTSKHISGVKYARNNLFFQIKNPEAQFYDTTDFTVKYKITDLNSEAPTADDFGDETYDNGDESVTRDKTQAGFTVYIYVEPLGEEGQITAYDVYFLDSFATPTIEYVYVDDEQTPIALETVKDGYYVPPNAELTLTLADTDIIDSMKPRVYNNAWEKNENGAWELVEGTTQSRVELSNGIQYSVPLIQYDFIDSLTDTAYEWKTYSQETPLIYEEAFSNIATEITEPQTAEVITIPSTYVANDTVYLAVKMTDVTGDKDGEPIVITMKIQPSATAPTFTPASGEQVSVNDKITIHSTEGNTEIYYNFDTSIQITQEMVEEARLLYAENSNYVPPQEDITALRRYTDLSGITVTYKTTNFNIQAVAVSPLNYNPSNVRYSVNTTGGSYQSPIKPLTQAEPPVASPDPKVNDLLAKNEQISLTTDLENAFIYYTINGTSPDPVKYENLLADGNVEELELLSTKRIATSQTISMTPDNTGLCIVRAVVSQPDVALITNAPSDVVTFTYRLETAEAPTINPPTAYSPMAPDEEAIDAVVLPAGASIFLTATQNNSDIYYATGTYQPEVTVNDDGTITLGANTFLYDPEQGITMPYEGSNFFVSVLQYSREHPTLPVFAPSSLRTYTYVRAADVFAPVFSPVGGIVTAGTSVELSSNNPEGTKILYNVFYDSVAEDAELDITTAKLYDPEEPILIDRDQTILAMAENGGAYSATERHVYTLATQLSAPTASLKSGSIIYSGYTLELGADAGSNIVYTKDGSDPSDPANTATFYGDEVVIDGKEGDSVTVRAYSTETGFTPSVVSTFTYVIVDDDDLLRATPTSDSDETYREGTTVSLSTGVTGGEIYYTRNGDDPVEDGREGTTVSLIGDPGETITIKAVVTLDEDNIESNSSLVKIFTYTLMDRSIAPSASIPSGAITLDGAQVSLVASSGSNIFYTTNGNDPTTSSMLYTGPITVSDSMILKAIAVEEDKETSNIATYVYTAADDVSAPQTNTPSGILETGTKITLYSATDGARIYYATDGTVPSEDNIGSLFEYTVPITISRPVTISMIAIKEGQNPSQVNSVTYTVTDPPIPEEDDQTEVDLAITNTDMLESRRDFTDQDAGPSFDGVVLQDPVNKSIVSAEENIIPKDTELISATMIATQSEQDSVSTQKEDYKIVQMYDISLQNATGNITPQGDIEVGLPIPADYQNGLVEICSIDSDGSIEFLPTRRSGGIAYAVVDDVSKYAITVPVLAEDDNTLRNLIIYSSIGAVALAVAVMTVTAKKKKGTVADDE